MRIKGQRKINILKEIFADQLIEAEDPFTEADWQKIKERVRVEKERYEGVNSLNVLIPLAGDTFSTEELFEEIVQMPDDDIPYLYRGKVRLFQNNSTLFFDGFFFTVNNFLSDREEIFHEADSYSYEELEALFFLFEKMFPKSIYGKEALDENEKTAAAYFDVSSPAMLWPDVYGSPFAEDVLYDIYDRICDTEIGAQGVFTAGDISICDQHSAHEFIIWLKHNGIENWCISLYEEDCTGGFMYLKRYAEEEGFHLEGNREEGWFLYQVDDKLREAVNGIMDLNQLEM